MSPVIDAIHRLADDYPHIAGIDVMQLAHDEFVAVIVDRDGLRHSVELWVDLEERADSLDLALAKLRSQPILSGTAANAPCT